MMITSTQNAKIKNVIQLQKKIKFRREQNVYVAEGLKMFVEAPRADIREVYVTPDFQQKNASLLKEVSCEVVDDRVFVQMSDTKTPQGIICVVEQRRYSFTDLIKKENPFLMVLEDLQDPGNVGTIFRTAEGAGADGIILTSNCVDIYNPKTIRATMGSVYRVPFLYTESIETTLSELKENGIRTFAAHLCGQNSYHQECYRDGTAFLIGNEGNGLSEQLADAADHLIRIPMEGGLESLNAGVAAAVLMYEVHRQRNSRQL